MQCYHKHELTNRRIRYNTSTGYYDVDSGINYQYLRNRQGSVMAVVDPQGNTMQRTGLYPTGTPFILPCDYRPDATNNLTPATDQLHIGNRWLSQSGLNYYDNTARMHDPLLADFKSGDPKFTDYPSLNHYSHCGANFANGIDPFGKDVVILNYGNWFRQHLAMLIQNENKKWNYYSVNGNNMFSSGTHIGGRLQNDVCVGEWDSPQEFLDSEYNQRNNQTKEDYNYNNYGFKEGYQIESTPEQDAAMREKFTDIANNTTYNLVFNNCATAVQKTMDAGGLLYAKPLVILVFQTSNPLTGNKISFPIFFKNPINPLPSSAFENIIEANPSGKYLEGTIEKTLFK